MAPPCCLESGRASLCVYSIAHPPALGSEISTLNQHRISFGGDSVASRNVKIHMAAW